MSIAHQESVGLGICALFFLVLFLLTINYQRREGRRHGWFFPSLILLLVSTALTVVTLLGGTLSGL